MFSLLSIVQKKIQYIYYIYARQEYNATSEQDEHNGKHCTVGRGVEKGVYIDL